MVQQHHQPANPHVYPSWPFVFASIQAWILLKHLKKSSSQWLGCNAGWCLKGHQVLNERKHIMHGPGVHSTVGRHNFITFHVGYEGRVPVQGFEEQPCIQVWFGKVSGTSPAKHHFSRMSFFIGNSSDSSWSKNGCKSMKKQWFWKIKEINLKIKKQ